jgi:DASS family divalent anion:Na+ symporter
MVHSCSGGVAENAWHLFAIFAATILGIILKSRTYGNHVYDGHWIYSPYTSCSSRRCRKINYQSTFRFGDKVIWLIGISFFIARGFIKTGLETVLLFYLSEFLVKVH